MVIGSVIPILLRNLNRREKLEVVAVLIAIIVAGLVTVGLIGNYSLMTTLIVLCLPFGVGVFISGAGLLLKNRFNG